MSNEQNEKYNNNQNDLQSHEQDTQNPTVNQDLYQVTFNGDLNFSDVKTIKNQLALDYHKPSTDFDAWFIGKPIVLKKSISYKEAKSVAAYFIKLGMIIDIQDMANLPPVLEQPSSNTPYYSNTAYASLDQKPIDYLSQDGLNNNQSIIKPAGFWVRLGAFLIDTVILTVISILINFLLSLFGLDIMSEIEKSNPEIITKFLTLDTQSQDVQIQIWMEYLQAITESSFFYLLILLKILYFAIFQASSYQATIGKRLLGIMIINQYGNPLSFSKSFFRSIFLNFPTSIINLIFNIGCLMIFFTKNKQGLHDKIVGSYVIYGRTDNSNKDYKI